MELGSVLAMRGWIRWKLRDALARRARRFRHRARPACAATWCGITASSGYCRSQRSPLRECSRTSSCSMKAMARTPSHFTSKSHSSPRGGLSDERRLHRLDGGRHGGLARAFEAAEVELGLFFWRCRAAAGAARGFRAPRLAGGLLAHTRSAAPAVSRLVLRAGRLLRDLLLRAAGEHAVGVRFHVPARHARTRRAS